MLNTMKNIFSNRLNDHHIPSLRDGGRRQDVSVFYQYSVPTGREAAGCYPCSTDIPSLQDVESGRMYPFDTNSLSLWDWKSGRIDPFSTNIPSHTGRMKVQKIKCRRIPCPVRDNMLVENATQPLVTRPVADGM
jgi:hypothetical protein